MDFSNKEFSSLIDINAVHYIANLIRLKIDDKEARVFSHQFSQIIEYFQKLTEIDTEDIQPTNENWAMNNIFRDDVIKPSMSREEFLNNTPHHDGYFVRVPRIFDDR
ncbi:MAG: Asp-tRNA(Asn)/Glu-tRNA(Gln) amidotransferase subunit GatC [Chloroflexota bacterium]